jgi:hypothetical protein
VFGVLFVFWYLVLGIYPSALLGTVSLPNRLSFGAWDLEFIWDLVFGIWDLSATRNL